MISNNAYYELFASYTVPDHNRVGYWVDLGANSKGKVIKTYNENLKKWVKVTDATSEDAVAPFIGNNGNWWIDNRDTGINASGHSPYIGDNSNWFVYSSERNEHIDTGLPSRGEAGPKGDKGDKGKDATINGVGSIKIEAGDNITITQSDDTLTIIGDVQKPDLSNYATKTEVTKLDNKLQDAVSSVFRAKGSVKTYNNLPVDKVSIGDVYNVLDTGANYVAISINPITWDKLSETVDLSKFFNKNEIDSLLSTKVDKQEGKQLTTEDFTTVLKRKLEGLSNYNDTEIRNAIDSLESAFNTLVEGNATVAIDTFNEIVAFLKNVENSQDLDSIIAGINTTISKVEAKIPDTNNFLSKDGGTMNNTNLVGNLNAELLNGYSSDKFVNIHNLINGTATDATTVGLNTINQDYLWTNTPYSDIATLMDISYSPDWRSLFFISPSTKRIHTRFKSNGDTWSNWKEIAFTDGSVANADMLDGLHSNEFLIKGPRVYSKEDFDTKYRFASMYSTDYMSPVDGAYNYGQVLSFVDNCSTTQFYCPDNTGLIYFRNKWGTDSYGSENFANIPWYEIITSKNIGSQTVESAKKFVPRYITNLNTDGIDEFFSSGFQPNNRPSNNNYATGFTVYNSELAHTYQFTFDTYGDVYTRYKNTTDWQPWRRLAFTDDPAAAANKLSTTRYLWGQPFDGSGDVYGDLKSMDGYNFASTTSNYVLFGYGYAQNNKAVYLDGSPIYFRYGTNHNVGMILNSNGNVGIGTTTPTVPLHVMGKPIFHTNAHFGNAGAMHIQNDYTITGWDRAINIYYPNMGNGANANIHIGAMDSEKNGGYIAYHYAGYNSDNNCMKIGLYAVDDILNVTANRRVGINTTTPRDTLDVNGNIKLNGEIRFKEGERLDQYGNLRFGEVSDNWGIYNSSGSKVFTVKNGDGHVGIGTSHPEHTLDVNGHAIFRKHIVVKEDYHIYMNTGKEGVYYTGDGLYWHNAKNEYVRSLIKVNNSGYVGIGINDPEYKLDVNGNVGVRGPMAVKGTIFMSLNTSLFMADENVGIYLSDYGIHWHNSDNTWHSSIMTCDGSVIYLDKPLRIKSDVHLTDSDQINGTQAGIALNYECGKAVNTTIWDGKGHHIMRVFGEDRRVAIGPAAIESPRGTLNVDGEVIFESSRFTTTSGRLDEDYAYSHAIYGGYHGIDVCEFYENEFRFKSNGGAVTLLKLTSDDAFFNGVVHSSYSSFVGHWNDRERFRLIRDAEFNTWLQAATDTTNEGGKLFMSGMYGAHLSEFNVLATTSNFEGSIIAEGDVTAYSDIRLKNRIESVNNVLDTIDTLDVFRYTWKDREDKSIHIGVSAQQVQAVYPEFVLTSSPEDGIDYLTVNYAALATCIAIQGIKELAKKGDERDKRIAALEEEVISLKEQLRYGNK